MKALASEGFSVEGARCGGEALDRIADRPPDLILMDTVLPDMEGSEVVAGMREWETLREVPVLFLSGIVGGEETGAVPRVLVGGRHYPALAKPFSLRTLREAVRGILQG